LNFELKLIGEIHKDISPITQVKYDLLCLAIKHDYEKILSIEV